MKIPRKSPRSRPSSPGPAGAISSSTSSSAAASGGEVFHPHLFIKSPRTLARPLPTLPVSTSRSATPTTPSSRAVTPSRCATPTYSSRSATPAAPFIETTSNGGEMNGETCSTPRPTSPLVLPPPSATPFSFPSPPLTPRTVGLHPTTSKHASITADDLLYDDWRSRYFCDRCHTFEHIGAEWGKHPTLPICVWCNKCGASISDSLICDDAEYRIFEEDADNKDQIARCAFVEDQSIDKTTTNPERVINEVQELQRLNQTWNRRRQTRQRPSVLTLVSEDERERLIRIADRRRRRLMWCQLVHILGMEVYVANQKQFEDHCCTSSWDCKRLLLGNRLYTNWFAKMLNPQDLDVCRKSLENKYDVRISPEAFRAVLTVHPSKSSPDLTVMLRSLFEVPHSESHQRDIFNAIVLLEKAEVPTRNEVFKTCYHSLILKQLCLQSDSEQSERTRDEFGGVPFQWSSGLSSYLPLNIILEKQHLIHQLFETYVKDDTTATAIGQDYKVTNTLMKLKSNVKEFQQLHPHPQWKDQSAFNDKMYTACKEILAYKLACVLHHPLVKDTVVEVLSVK